MYSATSIRRVALGAFAVSSLMLSGGSASAQVVTGTLGQPSATTTVNGKSLPAPEPPFGGVIKETLDGSKTWWPPRIVPPKGAPNILLIMLAEADKEKAARAIAIAHD